MQVMKKPNQQLSTFDRMAFYTKNPHSKLHYDVMKVAHTSITKGMMHIMFVHRFNVSGPYSNLGQKLKF